MPKTGKIRIGTSGWSYKHWMNGVFYPPKLASRCWLKYFTEHFDTVELNASFYRLPTNETVRNWTREVPKGFTFAVKMWKHITHTKKLNNCRDKLDIFFDVVNDFGAAHGPLLVQLPPMLKKNPERLDAFLTDLNEVKRRRWPIAVEFRNASWLDNDVMDVLNRHRAALVLQDMPYCLTTEPNDAPFVYVRRHGHSGSYNGSYSEEQIAADAELCRQWSREGRDVYVYYNNDIGGHAIYNGRVLRELTGGGTRK